MARKKISRTLLEFTIISIAIAIFIRLINFVGNDYNIDILLDYKSFLISFIYAMCIGLANVIGFGIIYKMYSWDKDAKKLAIIGVIGSVAWSTLGFFLARFTHLVIVEDYSFSEFIENEDFFTYLFSMMIAFIITLAFHVFYFYKALQDSKLKEKTFESESNSAKFDALKNQLDPHFLFNSLNVLSALIDEDPDKAQDFTIGLSQVYRYVLDQKNKDLVSLNDEIKFARTYLNLLMMRFEDSIAVDIDENANKIKAKVIPLSLQLLLENAIKHNRISEKNPLKIKIFIEGDMLVIENNYQPKVASTSQKRNGIGLDNIKSRYKLFTDKKCQVQKTENSFTVKLPLVQLEID